MRHSGLFCTQHCSGHLLIKCMLYTRTAAFQTHIIAHLCAGADGGQPALLACTAARERMPQLVQLLLYQRHQRARVRRRDAALAQHLARAALAVRVHFRGQAAKRTGP